MIRITLRILWALAIFVYGIPGMISNWEMWESWLSEWKWWNFLMVGGGLIWLIFELVSLAMKNRFSKDFDVRGGLRAFLHYQISGRGDVRVWHLFLTALLFLFAPAISALALVVFHYGGEMSVAIANSILEFFGLSSTIYPEQVGGWPMLE